MQIFSLFIVCSVTVQLPGDGFDKREKAAASIPYFLVSRGKAQQGHARARVLSYFRVPRDEQRARVSSYVWVPREERHASIPYFGYRNDKQSPANSRWPSVDDGSDDNKVLTMTTTKDRSRQRNARTTSEAHAGCRRGSRRKQDQRGGWPSTESTKNKDST